MGETTPSRRSQEGVNVVVPAVWYRVMRQGCEFPFHSPVTLDRESLILGWLVQIHSTPNN